MYLHLIKDRLYCGSNVEIENIRFTLEKCYYSLNKALWPIAPFMVEESWSYYGKDIDIYFSKRIKIGLLNCVDSTSHFHQQTINSVSKWKNEEVEDAIDTALEVKRVINQKANSSKSSWFLSAKVKCGNDRTIHQLRHLHPDINNSVSDSELCEILQVQAVTLAKCPDLTDDFNVEIDEITDCQLCPRCRRYMVPVENEVCHRCREVLEMQK